MFLIWGLNQNADKEWIREFGPGSFTRLRLAVGGSKNTSVTLIIQFIGCGRWATRSHSRLLFTQKCVPFLKVAGTKSVPARPFPTWRGTRAELLELPLQHTCILPPHLLLNLFAAKVKQQKVSSTHMFEPSSSLPRRGVHTVILPLWLRQLFLWAIHHSTSFSDQLHIPTATPHDEKKRGIICVPLTFRHTPLHSSSWLSWLLWSMEARGHFGSCTPEFLKDQV